VDPTQVSSPAKGVWGYWIPEARLVVGAAQAQRRYRYVLNWLAIREEWLYITRSNKYRRSMFARWWRAYLDDGFSEEARPHQSKIQDRAKVLEALTSVFAANSFSTADIAPTWFGKVISTVDDTLCRQVAWELSEIGFQAELLMLDATFYVPEADRPEAVAERVAWMSDIFPGGGVLHVSSIPTKRIGLASSTLSERAKCLEALRCIMKSWPNPPGLLKSAPPLPTLSECYIAQVESVIAQFCIDTFVKLSGRAPILPRLCLPIT
jgi:hypothetical protein